VVDANEALNRFMRDSHPDLDRLAEIIEALDVFRRAEADNEGSRLTVFGNMAAPLLAGGNTAATVANREAVGSPYQRSPGVHALRVRHIASSR
jgi:hypothetical protein